MAVDLTNVVSQYVSFGTLSNVQGLASRTFLGWVNFDALSGSEAQAICYPNYGTGTNEYWSIFIAVTSKVLVTTIGWTSVSGAWGTNSAMTTGRHHMAITYSNSATTNDPIIYVDGSSVAITEAATPAGSYRSGTTTTTFCGATNTGADKTIDGKIESLLIYNRIMTATEVSDAYASKLAIPDWRGLVFAPQLWQRGEVGEGGTLTASHTIADAVSGALGTPAGSPLHRQDAYLTY